jgi:hypothetical protein
VTIRFLSALLLLYAFPAIAQDEDRHFVCPVLSVELAKQAAIQVKGAGKCSVFCRGCGCKGGPGYRATSGECVSYAQLIAKCGPPPHARCTRECAPVHASCLGMVLGRTWLKDLIAAAGTSVTFQSSELRKEEQVKLLDQYNMFGAAAENGQKPARGN